jgi:ribosome-associated protein
VPANQGHHPLTTLQKRSGARKPAAGVPGLPQGSAPAPLSDLILSSLDDAKAENVVTLDLDGKAALADQMVIASGRSNRHVAAIADQLVEKLKSAGRGNLRVEGLPHCDWVLVDAGDVIVHIFRPEVRTFYNLEKLWSPDAPRERATH